jgi:hypothetical protein
MNEKDIQKIAIFARIGAEVVELGVTTYGKVKALLAAEGQDDQALQGAIDRLDVAIEKAKAEAGQ